MMPLHASLLASLLPSLSAGGGATEACAPVASSELLAPVPAAGAFFAETVRSDGARAVLGAYADATLGTQAGAAFVYRYDGGWTLEAELLAPDGTAGDHFGRSADVSGEHLIVGAYRDGPSSAGSAYAWRRSGTSWTFVQKLTAFDPGPGDRFGRIVAVLGDLAAIGAPFDADVGPDGGSAYLYRWDGSAWGLEQKLLPSDGTTDDRFGKAFGLGEDCVLVGASLHEAPGAAEAGAAYVYRRDTLSGAWSEEAVLRADAPQLEERLGVAVALGGAPGAEVAVVGASDSDDAGLSGCGAAYVFRRVASAWLLEQRLLASDREADEGFGWTVAIEGETILVGAVQEREPGLSNAGAVYVFRRLGTTWAETAKLVAPVREAGEQLGASLALAGGRALVGCNRATVAGEPLAGRSLEFALAPCVASYCFGDGSGAACPCDNAGLSGHGCDNAQATGGVVLAVAVHAPDGTGGGSAELHGSGFPSGASPTVVVIRSLLAAADGGAAFGDGLLCLGAPVVRLTTSFAAAGEATLSIGHGAGTGLFRYQLWYRSNGAFCTPERFNLSNGLSIEWP